MKKKHTYEVSRRNSSKIRPIALSHVLSTLYVQPSIVLLVVDNDARILTFLPLECSKTVNMTWVMDQQTDGPTNTVSYGVACT